MNESCMKLSGGQLDVRDVIRKEKGTMVASIT